MAFALQVSVVLTGLVSSLPERIRSATARRASIGTAAVLVAACLWPTASAYGQRIDTARRSLAGEAADLPYTVTDYRQLVQLARWLREHTPSSADFWAPDAAPEYGILCGWAQGHVLRYYSHRATCVDNFGDDVSPENFALAEDYFAAPSEAQAMDVLERLAARYVVVNSTGSGWMEGYRPDSQFARLRQWHRVGLSHHRLIYETPPRQGPGVPPQLQGTVEYQVFEVVQGAVLEGRAGPGAVIQMKLDLVTGFGRTITHLLETRADDRGQYSFPVTHPTGVARGAIRTGEHYELRSGVNLAQVTVDERAIRTGATVTVPAFFGAPPEEGAGR